jgi:hypothetical protein
MEEEIEGMEEEAIETEIRKMEEVLEKRSGVAGSRGRGSRLGGPPLTLAKLCLILCGRAGKCLYCL